MEKKLRTLVTETPEGNYQCLHNMTGIDENKCVYLRDYNGEGNLDLVDYCKRECKAKCDIDQEGTAEDFAENMHCDCSVSLLYHMAVGHAELRHHLGEYEATGLGPEGVQKLINLSNKLVEEAEEKEPKCDYREDEDGTWSCSECPTAWTFTDGGPEENRVNYCPECGRKISSWIKHVEEV